MVMAKNAIIAEILSVQREVRACGVAKLGVASTRGVAREPEQT